MEATYGTPEQLVEGLQRRGNGARSRFWHLLRQPVERLMGELIRQHGLDEDSGLLTDHALHAAETALRARPSASYAGVGWNAFRASVLLQIARITASPHGGDGATAGPAPLPDAPDYQCDTFFRPYTRLGNQFFGGDWYAGRSLEGSLWVFVADVTGHGYFAYLLATALPDVWQHCWNCRGLAPQPAELLAAMHEQLSDSLPEGIFLECTLARLDPDGRAVISPAGGTRLIVRRDLAPPRLIKLRGAWLGLAAPKVADQYELTLERGDELVLATDGVFDQLEDDGGAEEVSRGLGDGTAFEALRQGLERSLARQPQKDDITLVLMRRREEQEAPVFLRFPSTKAGDVPV